MKQLFKYLLYVCDDVVIGLDSTCTNEPGRARTAAHADGEKPEGFKKSRIRFQMFLEGCAST